MTIACSVCKKQPIPGDNSRSFHKFPDNEEQKQKWMQVTGVSYVSKHTKICSDHFYANSFHDTDGYTTKRRLLPNAIPYRTLNTAVSSNIIIKSEIEIETLQDFTANQSFSTPIKSEIDTETLKDFTVNQSLSTHIKSEIDTETLKDFTVNQSFSTPIKSEIDSETLKGFTVNQSFCTPTKSGIESEMSKDFTVHQSFFTPIKCEVVNEVSKDLTVDQSSTPTPQCSTSTSTNNCLKRKVCPIDVKNFNLKKKIRFMDGYQATHISREDFSSDQAWIKFIKYHIYRTRQIQTDRKRKERQNKKIANLMKIVKSLREEHALVRTN